MKSGWIFCPSAKASCPFVNYFARSPIRFGFLASHALPNSPGARTQPDRDSAQRSNHQQHSRGAWQRAGRATRKGIPPQPPAAYGLQEGPSPRRRTCSAHVTPAMPPPTTTNVPACRAASMLPGGWQLTVHRGSCDRTSTGKAAACVVTSGACSTVIALRVPRSPFEYLPRVLHLKAWRQAFSDFVSLLPLYILKVSVEAVFGDLRATFSSHSVGNTHTHTFCFGCPFA